MTFKFNDISNKQTNKQNNFLLLRFDHSVGRTLGYLSYVCFHMAVSPLLSSRTLMHKKGTLSFFCLVQTGESAFPNFFLLSVLCHWGTVQQMSAF